MSDRKESTMKALLKHHEKDLKVIDKLQGKGRRNNKPEKLVETVCMLWMRDRGFNVQVIDSTANWNGRAWVQQGAKQGTTDCVGNTPEGIACFIEFKALGRLATFHGERNQKQQWFVIKKIETNCFSCVVDSVDRLARIYTEWCVARAKSPELARAYLLKELP